MFKFFVCFGVTPTDVQGFFLALCSGETTGFDLGTISSARIQNKACKTYLFYCLVPFISFELARASPYGMNYFKLTILIQKFVAAMKKIKVLLCKYC